MTKLLADSRLFPALAAIALFIAPPVCLHGISVGNDKLREASMTEHWANFMREVSLRTQTGYVAWLPKQGEFLDAVSWTEYGRVRFSPVEQRERIVREGRAHEILSVDTGPELWDAANHMRAIADAEWRHGGALVIIAGLAGTAPLTLGLIALLGAFARRRSTITSLRTDKICVIATAAVVSVAVLLSGCCCMIWPSGSVERKQFISAYGFPLALGLLTLVPAAALELMRLKSGTATTAPGEAPRMRLLSLMLAMAPMLLGAAGGAGLLFHYKGRHAEGVQEAEAARIAAGWRETETSPAERASALAARQEQSANASSSAPVRRDEDQERDTASNAPRDSEDDPPQAGVASSVPPYQTTLGECEPYYDVLTLEGDTLRHELARVRRGQVPDRLPAQLVASCEVSYSDISAAFNQGGLVAHRERDYERAVELWEAAVEIDPSKLSARYNLACGYAVLSRREEAIEQLRQIAGAGADGRPWIDRAQTDEDLVQLRNDATFREVVLLPPL